MKALIIGAGIGGLVTALRMHQAGIDVEVFEAVSELKALGLGINLQPHATRELASLGLLEELKTMSVLTTHLDYRSTDGKLIFSDPRGLRAGYDYPQLSIHRGQLQMVLLKAFNERIGAERLHLSHAFMALRQDEQGVTAKFAHAQEYQGDVLVGADGIKSVVRGQTHPHEPPLHFEGIMMWRGASYQKPPFDGATISVCGNASVELISYPISARDATGKALINWVVEVLNPAATTLPQEVWNRPGRISDFKHHFNDWHLDFLDINALFEESPTVLEYPMVDRDPLPFWSQGRVTLLGDAAHPMYPRGGNGASQAIVDATVLVRCLTTAKEIPVALKQYEAERLPITARVVQNNRSQNQTKIFAQIDQQDHTACIQRHTCIDSQVLREIIESYKVQTGGSVKQVNAKS